MSWVLTAVAIGGAVLSASQQKAAAEGEEEALERQAEQEKIAAEGRELQRRQEVNKLLAANAVSLASSGITGEGTPQSISLESAKAVSVSEGLEVLSDRLRESQLRRQGRNIASQGRAQAASTLLRSASNLSGVGNG